MPEAPRYIDDVMNGERLPELVKEITLPRMMVYGAATWDYVRLHYDADYARELGFPGPFVDGQMLGAFLAQLVQDWAGPGAFIRKLGFRNRAMAYPGDTITCQGEITGVAAKGLEPLVECSLSAKNQRGEAVVDGASALVRLPSRPS